MIPQLRDLEHRFPNELAVVGVHSGKYTRERETARIRDASNRLRVAHPVVNDRQFRMWRAYAVRAWPTIVLLDPTGHVLGTHAGELTADEVAPTIERLIGVARPKGAIDDTPFPITPEPPSVAPGQLCFPGKIAVDGERVVIADSGHHRLLVGRLLDGGRRIRVERSLGGPQPGFVDGAMPSFDMPQGVAFDGDMLYVADSENHAIRACDLTSGVVRTIAGTGSQLRTRADREAGALSSPWDVTLVDRTLFIAMAGMHQIWALDLTRGGRARRHSGSNREDIIDGGHADAALAQPMGITSAGARLFFTDAESSAVRWADVDPSGGVGTIVGTGLFDFGDRDGAGDDVRMQHQQGIARHRDGRLLVADSYNDALKWVVPEARRVDSWVRGLHEPGGVALVDGYALVADTNAHRIVRVDERSAEVEEVEIESDDR